MHLFVCSCGCVRVCVGNLPSSNFHSFSDSVWHELEQENLINMYSRVDICYAYTSLRSIFFHIVYSCLFANWLCWIGSGHIIWWKCTQQTSEWCVAYAVNHDHQTITNSCAMYIEYVCYVCLWMCRRVCFWIGRSDCAESRIPFHKPNANFTANWKFISNFCRTIGCEWSIRNPACVF